MFASSEKLLEVDQVAQVVGTVLMGHLSDLISPAKLREISVSIETELRKQTSALGSVSSVRPLVSIDADDIRAVRPDLDNQQIVVVLNSDWSHLSETTIRDVIEESLVDKIEALYPEAEHLPF